MTTEHGRLDSSASQVRLDTHLFPNSGESSFFYSARKQLESSDDYLFYQSITAKYPRLSADVEDDEAGMKAAMVELLADERFVDKLMNYFGLTQYDFFKLMCARWGGMFKGMFLKKIQRLLEKSGYMGAD